MHLLRWGSPFMNWYPSLVCYSGHLESKMVAKILKSSDLDQIWFPNRLWCCELISKMRNNNNNNNNKIWL
jgi:hypothetical protein